MPRVFYNELNQQTRILRPWLLFAPQLSTSTISCSRIVGQLCTILHQFGCNDGYGASSCPCGTWWWWRRVRRERATAAVFRILRFHHHHHQLQLPHSGTQRKDWAIKINMGIDTRGGLFVFIQAIVMMAKRRRMVTGKTIILNCRFYSELGKDLHSCHHHHRRDLHKTN